MKTFKVQMKMAELVETNYHLLAVLSRLGVEEAFGERTVQEVCVRNNLDPGTFLLICNVYTFDGYRPVRYEGERTDHDHYVGITYLERA